MYLGSSTKIHRKLQCAETTAPRKYIKYVKFPEFVLYFKIVTITSIQEIFLGNGPFVNCVFGELTSNDSIIAAICIEQRSPGIRVTRGRNALQKSQKMNNLYANESVNKTNAVS